MARKTGAPESEENKDQKPTDEAAAESVTKEVVKEEGVDEVPGGAAVTDTDPEGPEETETEPEVSEEPDGAENHEDDAPENDIPEETTIKPDPVPTGPARATVGEADQKHHVEKKKKKMFRIILDEQDNSDKNNDQLVTDPSDGKQYLIKRGFEVDVPEGVVNNLRESIQSRLEYDENGVEVWRNIPRFAMRIIKELN